MQPFHEGGHAARPIGAGIGNADGAIAVVAVATVEGIDCIDQVHALLLIVLGHLADDHARADGVLVAYVRARAIAVTFLETEHVAIEGALGGKVVENAADVFEAGKGAHHGNAVVGGDRVDHDGGHDRAHDKRVGTKRTPGGAHLADVVEHQNAHLVAGEQGIVVAVFAGHAHAVGVGIGRQQEIGVHLLAQLDALLHSFANLGVGIGAGGEIAIGIALFGHHRHVGHADALEQA